MLGRLHVRRMVIADWPNRGDVVWALFEEGQLGAPLRILTDLEMKDLIKEVHRQEDRARS